MSITVRHNNYITKSDFFFVGEDNYDEHIELAIPFYLEMHEEMLRFLPQRPDIRVLDLGTGTGKTIKYIFKNHPEAEVVGVDLFDEMLAHAKKRLFDYGEKVRFIQGDFRYCDLGYGYDACVGALALHHLLPAEKRTLFKNIYSMLNPGGVFVMIDWTKFQDPAVEAIAAETAIEHARKSVPDQHIVDEWTDHWKNKNIPDTVEVMQAWLMEAGFKSAECPFRYYGMAMIVAERRK